MENFNLSDFANVANIISLIVGGFIGSGITLKICGNNNTVIKGSSAQHDLTGGNKITVNEQKDN